MSQVYTETYFLSSFLSSQTDRMLGQTLSLAMQMTAYGKKLYAGLQMNM